MKVAIYCRVSSSGQNETAQVDELLAFSLRAGWTVVQVYRETASGSTSPNERRELRELLASAKRREFSMVLVWSADRLGRSMRHLVAVLSELHDCGIHICSYKQNIDTSHAMGAMLWQFLGIFAEFENTIRRERQELGIRRAKARGVKFGRPPSKKDRSAEILELRRDGWGINKIATQLRIGSDTVRIALRDDAVRIASAND